MPNPLLAQLDPRYHALAQRVSDAIADVLDGEILAPWEVCLVVSIATFGLHLGVAQYLEEQATPRELATAIQRWLQAQEGPHA